MAAIAMALALGGYGGVYWGISLITGKNVSLSQMFNPVGKYPQLAKPFSQWPKAANTVVLPNGTAADNATGGGSGSSGSQGTSYGGSGAASAAGFGKGSVGGGHGR